MNKKAVSIRGKAVNIGPARLKEVFEQNPYMAEIYPQEESRTALEVFRVAEGIQALYLRYMGEESTELLEVRFAEDQL